MPTISQFKAYSDIRLFFRSLRSRWTLLIAPRLLILYTIGLIGTVVSPAYAQDAAEEFMNVSIITSGAHACGASREDALKASAAITEEFGRKYPALAGKLTRAYADETIIGMAESFKKGASDGQVFGKPCSFYRQGLDMLLGDPAFLPGLVGQASSTETPDENMQESGGASAMSLSELREALKSASDSLPRGRLTGYVGCWRSAEAASRVTLCFTKGGDSIDVELAGPSGGVCDYSGGEARARGDGAFIYAFATTGKCSNGQATEHMEGYCELQDGFECLTSFFSEGNLMLQLNEDAAGANYNNSLKYTRVTE